MQVQVADDQLRLAHPAQAVHDDPATPPQPSAELRQLGLPPDERFDCVRWDAGFRFWRRRQGRPFGRQGEGASNDKVATRSDCGARLASTFQ
jgi:hypothetical protein